MRRSAPPGGTFPISLSPRRTARALALVVLCLTLASIAGHLLEPVLGEFVKLVSVGSDTSVPAWYSSLALLFCSGLIALVALFERRTGGRYRVRWVVLSLIFAYLSADEMLTLHERASSTVVQPALGALGYDPGGLLNYPWVVLYGPLVLVFLLLYAGFFFALPAKTRGLFLVAGLLFVGGGIGVEMINALYDYLFGRASVMAVAMTHLEEVFEMAGVVVFAYALMDHVASQLGVTELQVRLRDGGSNTPPEEQRQDVGRRRAREGTRR